jgi:hypothetical protein
VIAYADLPAHLLAMMSGPHDQAPWPRPTPPSTGIHYRSLATRRSQRSWTGPPAPALIAESIDAARQADTLRWPDQPALDVLVLSADTSPPGTHPLMQHDLAAAPVLLLWHGDLTAALAEHGGHGYRLLLTRAGAAAATCLLHAQHHGAVGCMTDGMLPALRESLHPVDGVNRLALIAVALGRPATKEAP